MTPSTTSQYARSDLTHDKDAHAIKLSSTPDAVFAHWVAFGLALGLTLGLSGCYLAPGAAPEIVNSPRARPLVRQTTGGAVQGIATPQAQVFLGIQYAADPTGVNRFAPPQPTPPWLIVRPAVRIGPHCGDGDTENCLNLNIYAPSDASPARPRPVLVWIYGGAFILGANDQYDLSDLAARQDLIVVAPNYRLGALGFLAHPALSGPGEGAYGLLDIEAALRWVRDNIAAFGGDPAQVTAAGESAGAFGVCALMAAPAARGLFARAILQSGACAGRDSTVDRATAEQAGLDIAARLGCGHPPGALACLRALPASAFSWKSRRLGLSLDNGWSPMHGGDVLPLRPDEAFAANRYNPVPILQGTTANEGTLFAYLFTLSGRLLTARQADEITDKAFHGHGAAVQREYAAVDGRWRTTARVVTDARFACPAERLSRRLDAAGGPPVWTYEFDDPAAPFALPLFFQPSLEAFHASEIAYVLQRPWVLSGRLGFTPEQQRLADRMQNYWGRFARTGDPNGGSDPPWPRHVPGDEPFHLGVTQIPPDAAPFVLRHHCAFWDALGY